MMISLKIKRLKTVFIGHVRNVITVLAKKLTGVILGFVHENSYIPNDKEKQIRSLSKNASVYITKIGWVRFLSHLATSVQNVALQTGVFFRLTILMVTVLSIGREITTLGSVCVRILRNQLKPETMNIVCFARTATGLMESNAVTGRVSGFSIEQFLQDL